MTIMPVSQKCSFQSCLRFHQLSLVLGGVGEYAALTACLILSALGANRAA